MVRVGWAAWVPSPRGTVSLADTITLQVVGGPRPSPFDGFCFRDLSQSGLIRHSLNALRQLSASWPLPCAKIEIRFNFVPVTESGDRLGGLSLLSSQQTPLPRPDLRPHSSTAVHQVEDVQPPLSPLPQLKNTPAEAPNLTFEEAERQQHDLLSPKGGGDTLSVPRPRRLLSSLSENKQNAIEVELPSTRVSAFPRRVVQHFSHFAFPRLVEESEFKSIDPVAKRDILMELERIDKFGVNEVAFQFMAFKKLGAVSTTPAVHRIFFTFQFFSFDPITTESLFLDAESGGTSGEEPLILYRSGDEQQQNAAAAAPGLIVRFDIGTQRRDFLRYLLDECVHVHIWEADSLFHVGAVSVPLRSLLRQGSPAILCSIQTPVLQSGFPPGIERNQLVGLLYLRMANIGKRLANSQMRRHSVISRGEKALSLRAADGVRPLERFLAFQRMDLEQRSMRIFGGEEEARMRQWAQLKGRENGRLSGIASEGTAAKFLFSEELATYRALRREGKALALLRTVFSSVTTRLRAEAFGGQLVHLRFQLRNPFPDDCICAMEVNDRRLGPVVSKAELNFLRQQQQKRDFGGHCAFEWEEAAEAWTSLLRGMERVDVALCFDTGTAEEGWASNVEARAFFRRLPQGDPLAILEVAVSVSRPFLSQHFRWFADEGRKLVRTVPISRPSPLSEVASIRWSDPAVLCLLQNHSPGGVQHLRIECLLSRGLSDVRNFLVFFYSDPYHSELVAVYRFSLHSIGRLHASAVQGQQVRVQLGGFGPPPAGELVRLFCSSPEPSSSLGLLPSSSFASSAQSLAQMSVHFRPFSLGHCHILIAAVATSTYTMLAQWLLSVAVDEPNIAKVFEVIVPRGTEGIVRKRIPLHNPLGIARQFRFFSSDQLLLSLPTPLPPPIPPKGSVPLPLNIQTPQIRPSTLQTLLFVEDIQTGTLEEAFAVTVRFE
uniref:Nephrocystin-4 n=1 Tax=Globodera rostochiensis TaxID=31243 RepID=A0A914HHZ6_GLORO